MAASPDGKNEKLLNVEHFKQVPLCFSV